VLAVDVKTGKQGIDCDGNPLLVLNAFAHDIRAVIGQWSTGDCETNELSLFCGKLRGLHSRDAIDNVHDLMVFPQPIAVAKRADPAFRTHASTG